MKFNKAHLINGGAYFKCPKCCGMNQDRHVTFHVFLWLHYLLAVCEFCRFDLAIKRCNHEEKE